MKGLNNLWSCVNVNNTGEKCRISYSIDHTAQYIDLKTSSGVWLGSVDEWNELYVGVKTDVFT